MLILTIFASSCLICTWPAVHFYRHYRDRGASRAAAMLQVSIKVAMPAAVLAAIATALTPDGVRELSQAFCR